MDFLGQFENNYPTLKLDSVDRASDCNEPSLVRAIRTYQDRYNISFDWLCTFEKASIAAIQDSVISTGFRQWEGRLQISPVHLLFHSTQDPEISASIFRIAEIATCYQPSEARMKQVYQKCFSTLVKRLFESFFSTQNVDLGDSVLIAPLRAGRFVAREGLGTKFKLPVSEIHTKRIYYDQSSIALGIGVENLEDLSRFGHLIVAEGGIVSGVTLVGLLNLLAYTNSVPKRISICSVHAATYGIMNILNEAKRLGMNLDITAGITSYSISKTLYSYYDSFPWNHGTLVTGDIGDYLSP